MHKTIVAAATAFVIGGALTGAVLTEAQPAAPAAEADGSQRVPPPPPPWMGWRHHMGEAEQGGPVGGIRAFALVYRQADRALTPADVQKIAEAFLLWNGNHTWKVTNVAPMADGPIGFAITTADGSAVAKFTMDPHTGKVLRVG